MKKAQNASQIFTYIIAIVVVGIILLFGYNSIRQFSSQSEEIALLKFHRELTSSVKTIAGDYGTVKVKSFPLSTDYTKVCIIRTYKPDLADPPTMDTFKGYPRIEDAFNSDSKNNLFLFKSQGFEPLELGNVSFSDKSIFKCFNFSNGRLELKIEGRGDHAVLSAK